MSIDLIYPMFALSTFARLELVVAKLVVGDLMVVDTAGRKAIAIFQNLSALQQFARLEASGVGAVFKIDCDATVRTVMRIAKRQGVHFVVFDAEQLSLGNARCFRCDEILDFLSRTLPPAAPPGSN